MPVTFEIQPDRAQSVVTFAGLFTVAETETALAAFRAEGGQNFPCIFEFLRPIADFKVENIRRIVFDMAPPPGSGRPTAFVGDTDLAFELCSVIVRYIGQPERVKAFRTRDEAGAWLAERMAGRV